MARDPGSERPRARDDVRDNEREQTIELREEELSARKERRQAGEVQIGKEVVSEEKTLEVPVMHEEVTVERRAVDRKPSNTPIGEGETIEVPVYEEKVEFDKQAVVYEELSVGKRQVQETERVSDTVRREVVDWDEVRDAQRATWEERSKGSGRRWEDAEPGYRYSHEMSADPRYKGRAWDEVEPDLKADYAQRARTSGSRSASGDDAWEGLRQDAREAWEETHRR